MHGNVWEWVEDCWHASYAGNPPTDGSAWTEEGKCNFGVVRGGSFDLNPEILRSGSRYRNTSVNRLNNLGFRVSRTLTP
jgi:formylglycine-generating enzyme required for sulfatase activity